MKRITALGTMFGGACAAGLAAPKSVTAAQVPSPSFTRERVVAIIRENRKIVSPHGVEDLIGIPVNGLTQWLSIRGADASNPVLLYIHGGPGSPTMPAAWTFQRPWEDFFTVVEWDQRGAGKTYAANDPAKLTGTMTADQFVSDAESVVEYLRSRFKQKKIVVLGHSWGSIVGLELARRRPDMLHVYLGCGQIINSSRSESDGLEFALDRARAENNVAAIRELEALKPYPGPIGTLTVERISAQRKWLMYYGGLTYGRKDFAYDADTWALSPDYSERDVKLTDAGSLYSLTHLLGAVERANFDALTELKCPVTMFVGRHDYATSHRVTAQWFERVRAPQKRITWFENSAHMMMVEEQGLFLKHLLSDIQPLAG